MRPHGDFEAVTHEDAWLDPSIERGNRAVRFREPFHEFDFSFRAREMCHGRDPYDDVARRQADDEPVGVTENHRVIWRLVVVTASAWQQKVATTFEFSGVSAGFQRLSIPSPGGVAENGEVCAAGVAAL
jgi:hypothetical protein